MSKIVINKEYGGFGLSKEAILLGRKISGNPNWGGAEVEGDVRATGEIVPRTYGFIEGVARHNEVLVAVVEQLGEAASGIFAKLVVEEIPSGTRYRITEYDGMEWVETEKSIDWEVAP